MTRYIDGLDELRRLNTIARRNRYNRQLELTHPIFDDDARDTRFPVSLHFIHNDDHIRTRLILNAQGDAAYLDMPFGEFERLPTWEEQPA